MSSVSSQRVKYISYVLFDVIKFDHGRCELSDMRLVARFNGVGVVSSDNEPDLFSSEFTEEERQADS